MSAANPIAVSEEEPFVIGKSDLAYFFNNPCRCDLRTGSALYERSCPGDRRSSPGTFAAQYDRTLTAR